MERGRFSVHASGSSLRHVVRVGVLVQAMGASIMSQVAVLVLRGGLVPVPRRVLPRPDLIVVAPKRREPVRPAERTVVEARST